MFAFTNFWAFEHFLNACTISEFFNEFWVVKQFLSIWTFFRSWTIFEYFEYYFITWKIFQFFKRFLRFWLIFEFLTDFWDFVPLYRNKILPTLQFHQFCSIKSTYFKHMQIIFEQNPLKKLILCWNKKKNRFIVIENIQWSRRYSIKCCHFFSSIRFAFCIWFFTWIH